MIDPAALAGSDVYFDRVETLVAAMREDEGVRMPGERRVEIAARAAAHGVAIPDALAQQLQALAAT